MGRNKQNRRNPKKNNNNKYFKKRKTEIESGNLDKDVEGYTDIIRECPAFESYYKEQNIVPIEEWSSFMSTLRESLPVTFRITGSRLWAQNVLSVLEKRYFSELEGLEVEGERIAPPRPLTWYPDNLAWHLSLSRPVIRNSPLLSNFHSFLVKENNQGNISRQEAVSMIPPLLLGVEPHHYVLDMCAAPGSKTTQLIEALHSQDSTISTIPEGVVIANDIDNSRCYMLVHQAKRLNSPCLIVTNHGGTDFPILYHHDDKDVRHPLHYDRVLCDVPCSGDGTMRKNPTIWRTWNTSTPLSLHRTQLQLLVRGLELLKPGGQLVYSTCSLNPIEDEAVACTAVKISKGSVELMDCSGQLPGLKRMSGLKTWKVMSKDGKWLSSFNETPPTSSDMIQSSMFPPTQEEAESFHLDRCIRILPHQQNTGGFFVAKFHKLCELPWQRNVPPTLSEREEKPYDILGLPMVSKKKKSVYREDPYVFLSDTIPIVKEIISYYNISDQFPKNQFLTRTHTGKKKTLYLTSPLVKEITKRNEKDIKIINTGVRVFARCENTRNTGFRVTQEGISTMMPYISNCLISLTLTDLILLLKEPNPLTNSLSISTQEAIIKYGTMKPIIFTCVLTESEEEKANVDLQCPINLSGWIAAVSVRLYLSHPDRYHYLAILGETPPEYLSLKTQGAGNHDEEEELMMMEEEREEEERKRKQRPLEEKGEGEGEEGEEGVGESELKSLYDKQDDIVPLLNNKDKEMTSSEEQTEETQQEQNIDNQT